MSDRDLLMFRENEVGSVSKIEGLRDEADTVVVTVLDEILSSLDVVADRRRESLTGHFDAGIVKGLEDAIKLVETVRKKHAK